MDKKMAEEMAKRYIEKGIVADALIELYETVGNMAKIIDTLFGSLQDENDVKGAYNNDPYKEYIFCQIEQKYGEGGIDFFNFAVAYEMGKRSLTTA